MSWGNDMLEESTFVKFRHYLKILQEKEIKFFGWYARIFGEEYKNNLTAYILNLPKNFKYFYHFIRRVALRPELNLSDGKHPNSKGINVISKNLEKKLIDLLNK